MAEDVLVRADVSGASRCMALLDKHGFSPRAAILLQFSASGSWRLWIVPPAGVDHAEFYKRLAKLYASIESREFGLDIGLLTFASDEDPLVRAMRDYVGTFRDDTAWVADTVLDGVFVHQAVVLRMEV